MEGKAKIVFPIVITAIIVFVVSGVVTYFNIGLRPDFVPRWLSAFGFSLFAVGLGFVQEYRAERARS